MRERIRAEIEIIFRHYPYGIGVLLFVAFVIGAGLGGAACAGF